MRSIMLMVLVTLMSAFFTNTFALLVDESSDDFDVALRAIDFIGSLRGNSVMPAPMVEIEDGDLEEMAEHVPIEEVPVAGLIPAVELMPMMAEPVAVAPAAEPTMLPPMAEIAEFAPETEPVVETPVVDVAPVPVSEEGPIPRAQPEIEPSFSEPVRTERCQTAYDQCVVRCGSPDVMDFNCQDTGLVIQRSCNCQNVPGSGLSELPGDTCPINRCVIARNCCDNPGEECDLRLFRGIYDFSGYCDNDGDGEATNAIYTPRSVGTSCYCP